MNKDTLTNKTNVIVFLFFHKHKLTIETFIRLVKRRTVSAWYISVALNSFPALAIFSTIISCRKQRVK